MNHRPIAIIFSIALVLSAFVPHAFSQQSAGSIFSVQGEVSIKRGAKRFPAEEGLSLRPGDIVVTGEPGRVAVELPDGSYVRIASGSRMQLPGEKKALGLFEGVLHFLSHSEKHPVIETQTVTAAIRGTEFVLTSSGEDTTISMLSGIVDATSKHGSAHLKGGEGVSFRAGKGPDVFSILGGDNKVQWSMFVPFVAGDLKSKRGRDAVDIFMLGGRSSSRALGALKSISSRKPCSEEGVLYARLLLSSGAPEKGRAILLSCLTKKMPSGLEVQARASLAQFFLANGDVTKADDFSSSALDIAPTDTLARLVRSFVLQQRGDLTGALSLVEGSSEEELQAREAEVLFMFGRISQAEDVLANITASSWYTETLKGFLALANRDTAAAETLFESAAELESGAGLPQLGLGLVAAGRGELFEARSFLEKATILEPSRALYRSYLAKAYFEADTYTGAKPEFARAIELDPNDPTPHLYRSFLRVAENDLVGALDDITEARKLAGARSVYRSKFLLDQDSAVQSASIGRVYQQLGFKERGRIEALTAISSDYQNATAHRLLSQTQEDIFVADTIASEQRIANLFSPLSINVVDSIGTNVSLNEYSQLFEADGVRTATNTFYDSRDDFVKTGILTAIKDGNTVVGLSADGAVRDGASEKPRTTAGTFGFSVQSQPSWADRLLLEGKGIFFGSSEPDETTDSINGNISAAYLHRFSPEVTGVIQSSFNRDREHIYDRGFEDNFLSIQVVDGQEDIASIEGLFDERTKRYETTLLNEAQLIAKTGAVNSVLTLRNITNNIDGYSKSEIFEDDFGELNGLGATLRSNAPVNLSGNAVSYLGTFPATESLQLQFGGEFESIEWASHPDRPLTSDSTSRSLWSPKAGLIYNFDNKVALRAGYGESLGKTTPTDFISIEPTHIGGINQRINDEPGTRSRNFGLGLDVTLRKDWFAGAEWTKRRLREYYPEALYEYTSDFDEGIRYSSVSPGEGYYAPIGQDFLSTYIYHVFNRNAVGGIDYRFVKEDTNGLDPNMSRDHRAKIFGRYFLSGGLFMQGSAVYRYQSRLNNVVFGDGADGGWLMGAGVGYRLPTRQGLILLDVQNIFGQDIQLDQETYFNEPVFNDPTVRLAVNFNF